MYKDLKPVKRCLYNRHRFEIETSGLTQGIKSALSGSQRT